MCNSVTSQIKAACRGGGTNDGAGRCQEECIDYHLESSTGAVVGYWISIWKVNLAIAEHHTARVDIFLSDGAFSQSVAKLVAEGACV